MKAGKLLSVKKMEVRKRRKGKKEGEGKKGREGIRNRRDGKRVRKKRVKKDFKSRMCLQMSKEGYLSRLAERSLSDKPSNEREVMVF